MIKLFQIQINQGTTSVLLFQHIQSIFISFCGIRYIRVASGVCTNLERLSSGVTSKVFSAFQCLRKYC